MISVLIPIYNQPVSVLIAELRRQCAAINIPFEIIAIEDGSREFLEENGQLHSTKDVTYLVESGNIGRAAIRNKLASMANFDTLIFLDCDSMVAHADFVERYTFAASKSDVVYGGTTYQEQSDSAYALHHKYGVEREARPVDQRRSDPYTCFLTNNFCIDRKVFLDIKFDESLTQYGFEDSLFAWELKKRSIGVAHIDNTVVHIGLDTAPDFLEKTKLAVENAYTLLESGKIPADEIRMAKVYFSLQRWGVAGVLCGMISLLEKPMIKTLKSAAPRLLHLDLLKLKWMRDAVKRRLNPGS